MTRTCVCTCICLMMQQQQQQQQQRGTLCYKGRTCGKINGRSTLFHTKIYPALYKNGSLAGTHRTCSPFCAAPRVKRNKVSVVSGLVEYDCDSSTGIRDHFLEIKKEKKKNQRHIQSNSFIIFLSLSEFLSYRVVFFLLLLSFFPIPLLSIRSTLSQSYTITHVRTLFHFKHAFPFVVSIQLTEKVKISLDCDQCVSLKTRDTSNWLVKLPRVYFSSIFDLAVPDTN